MAQSVPRTGTCAGPNHLLKALMMRQRCESGTSFYYESGRLLQIRKARVTGMNFRALLRVCLILLLVVAPAAAKSYSADRFDAVVRVQPDGSLDVTETVVFSFTEGTFSEVFRELPARRTDGIEVVRAEMQGQPMPFGRELGTVEVGQRNGRVRVVWRFRSLEGATREFVLNYRVRGVVRQESDADVLVWRALPAEHRYPIASSALRFELPVAPLGEPGVTLRKTKFHQVSFRGLVAEVAGQRIDSNGGIDVRFRFPSRTVAATAPQWQQRAARIDAGGPKWIAAAVLLFALGLVLLVMWRQAYDAPPDASSASGRGAPHPPDEQAPALIGVLAANGRPALEHAMAAMFALAERGELVIEEEPKARFGSRTFRVTRRGRGDGLMPHEQQILEVMFGHPDGTDQSISLAKARGRLTRRARRISTVILRELAGAGLLDDARRALRRRYTTAAVALVVLAALVLVPAIPSIERFGPWPLLMPAALAAVGLASLIFAATITPLSNEGVRRAAQWREYRKHLRNVAGGSEKGGLALPRLLPYAVALGLASAWAKFMKTQPHIAPPWFRAMSAGDSAAFVAFVAHGGAGATSGAGGGAGGGAAGGGASGAS